jgi:hypothetical protein
MQCEWVEECPFLEAKTSDMPAMVDIFRGRYCATDSFSCARYQVLKVLGREAVPLDLYPNQVDRADEIIEFSKTWRGKLLDRRTG